MSIIALLFQEKTNKQPRSSGTKINGKINQEIKGKPKLGLNALDTQTLTGLAPTPRNGFCTFEVDSDQRAS